MSSSARRHGGACSGGGSSLGWAALASCSSLLLLLAGLGMVQACLPAGGVNQGVTQAKGTHVCIVFSTPNWQEDGTSNYSRIAFTPRTDRFTRLQFSDSYTNVSTEGLTNLYGPNVAVHVESMGVASYQKLYRAEDPLGRTFPVLTAIISVEKGVVAGITFDDGCVLCDNNDHCVENTLDYTGTQYYGPGATSDCYMNDDECASNAGNQTCNLSLYVTWTGTDARGNYLTSSSRRFSLFSTYSVQSYFNGLGKAIKGAGENSFNEG